MSSDIALLVRVTASLVAVVLLALAAARLARRGAGRRGQGDLCVRERVGLTRDTAAVVIETDGRRLLVGVSPGQVTLLADLGTTGPEPGDPTEGEDFVGLLPRQGRAATPAPRSGHASGPASDAASGPASGPAPAPVRVGGAPLSRKAIRELDRKRRVAMPPTQRGSGSVLDPRTWQQGLEALRDLTARRG